MKPDTQGCRYPRLPARNVNKGAFVLLSLLLMGVQSIGSVPTKKERDEASIRALENKFTAAFNAGDVDAIMKNYIPGESLFVFDIVPRKQYLGADAYRNDWADFFTHFKGTPKITIIDLGITVDDRLAFSHSIQHVIGTDKQGRPVDRMVRVTDGYRKIGGKWLIMLEHISVPIDLATGRAVITTKQ